MTYDSAVSRLYELGHELSRTPSHKFDLAYMRVLTEALRQFEFQHLPGSIIEFEP